MTDTSGLLQAQQSLFRDSVAPIALDEYQEFTTQTDRNVRQGIAGLDFVLLGLFGEVGSLLSELKKKQRDREAYVAYHDSVIEEFGDVLWYFSNASLRAGLLLSTIAGRISAKLADWDYHGRASARGREPNTTRSRPPPSPRRRRRPTIPASPSSSPPQATQTPPAGTVRRIGSREPRRRDRR